MNNQQKMAVECEKDLCIVAVPGSGKTTTGVSKTERILLSNPSSKVCYVVFNKTAADDIRDRLVKKGCDTSRLIVGTYHSLCLKQIRASNKRPKLVMGQDEAYLKFKAWRSSGCPCEESEVFQVIETFKSNLAYHSDPDLFDVNHSDDLRYTMFKKYQSYLNEKSLLDFYDLLIYSVQGMQSQTIEPVSCTHMICDEFQDTDPVQLAWVHLHKKLTGCILTVVGDDDQTIYSWRNAVGVSAFNSFVSNYDAERIVLNTNYRSHEEILIPADNLISCNQERISKTLVSNKGQGGSVSLISSNSFDEELDRIVEWADINRNNKSAILARTNLPLQQLSDLLTIAEIPHKRVTSETFWTSASACYIVDFLCAFALNKNKPSLERILAIQYKSDDIAEDIYKQTKKVSLPLTSDFPDSVLNSYNRFFDDVIKAKAYLLSKQDHRVSEGIALVEKALNSFIPEKGSRQVFTGGVKSASRALQKLKGTLSERIRVVEREMKDEASNLTLMTFHSSKGLEFDSVLIMKASEDTIPSKKSIQEGNYEEERRLFYVAMTRAERKLAISYSKEPCIFLVQSQMIINDKVDEDVFA